MALLRSSSEVGMSIQNERSLPRSVKPTPLTPCISPDMLTFWRPSASRERKNEPFTSASANFFWYGLSRSFRTASMTPAGTTEPSSRMLTRVVAASRRTFDCSSSMARSWSRLASRLSTGCVSMRSGMSVLQPVSASAEADTKRTPATVSQHALHCFRGMAFPPFNEADRLSPSRSGSG